MGQVVNLRASRPEGSEAYESGRAVLARMQSGELTSFFYIASGPGVDGEVGVCGELAEDLDHAKEAAIAGFQALFGHAPSISIQRRPLPRDLKKGIR